MLLSDVLPASIAWRPAAGDAVLLAGTQDDLPLIETVLGTLPARSRGQVFVEVPDADAIRPVEAPGRVCVTWLRRDAGQSLTAAVSAWIGEMLPVDIEREHRVYAWITGDGAAHPLTNA